MTSLADVVDLSVFDFDGTICESADVKTEALYQHYREVQGGPTLKGDRIRRFLAERGVSPDRLVMVGDQFSDLDAARRAEVLFVAYRPPQEDRLFDDDALVIEHFDQLAEAINAVAVGAAP